MSRVRVASLLAVGAVTLAGCTDGTPEPLAPSPTSPSLSHGAVPAGVPLRYVVIADAARLPAELDAHVGRAGGALTSTMPELGVALATSTDPEFMVKAGRIAGVRSVVPDISVRSEQPDPADRQLASVGYPPASTADDTYFNLQWGHTAIDAPGAWALGYRGAGARVFVLDSGIRSTHADLAANLNEELSTSFVVAYDAAGKAVGIEPYDSPPGNHGTHVAGTIAAVDNSRGVIGVAPEAEIVAVKVLSAGPNPSYSSYTLQGLYYAAANGADVINMSLGTVGDWHRHGWWMDVAGTPDDPSDDLWYRAEWVAEFANTYRRATAYARDMGALVVTSAGNDALDRDGDRDRIRFPVDLPDVLSVSGTGPSGWGLDSSVDLNGQSYYTDFGQSAIDLAAPGGNIDFRLIEGDPFDANGNPLWPTCTVAGVFEFCVHFDRIFSTTAGGGYNWLNGTSMAAPHVSGVAALVIGKHGGQMQPAQVEAILRRSALDLGKPGRDDLFGYGLVNAARAVR